MEVEQEVLIQGNLQPMREDQEDLVVVQVQDLFQLELLEELQHKVLGQEEPQQFMVTLVVMALQVPLMDLQVHLVNSLEAVVELVVQVIQVFLFQVMVVQVRV